MSELGQLVPIQTHVRKTGRPPNPAWQYFLRGAKRNGFHYHAYCKYCVGQYKKLHGEMSDENVFAALNSIRGVSSDMMKHLEKCCHCPQQVLTGLQAYWAEVRKVDEIVPVPKRTKIEQKELMKNQVWKATVAAGLDFQWFQHPLINTLISVPKVHGTLSEMTSVATLLGKTQFEKIKELKANVMLSVSAWKLQNDKRILSLSLVNYDGEKCAISVDVIKEWTMECLEDQLRKCLLLLRRNNVVIIGIIADSMLALQAAFTIQANDTPELIVHPCFTKMIDIIANVILTDPTMSTYIGTIIDIMSYLRHPKVQNVLTELQISTPMTNSVCSVVESVHTFITFQNIIEKNVNLLRLPKSLHELIVSKQWWNDIL
ncbi:hypothetical protein THRCLA_05032 [Thraustotheca clavata]|uniref:BED-type domain-containing protein n=1 Tax=Thraustotheca clavata TaxID=74557 RepID=A0A1V9ZX67_9STRA|nr:hypothetical protein THRCLA_05032 [Thraustotheca clavata]